MDKQMLFVYNPRAGKAKIRSNLLDIIDTFVKAGYEVTAYPTQAAGDAVKAVQERRAGYDMVVCSGGDGTLSETISGIDGIYMAIFLGIPLCNFLYRKLEPTLGRLTKSDRELAEKNRGGAL